ncbi:unnamed protein product [Aphanomyces euteiches]
MFKSGFGNHETLQRGWDLLITCFGVGHFDTIAGRTSSIKNFPATRAIYQVCHPTTNRYHRCTGALPQHTET